MQKFGTLFQIRKVFQVCNSVEFIVNRKYFSYQRVIKYILLPPAGETYPFFDPPEEKNIYFTRVIVHKLHTRKINIFLFCFRYLYRTESCQSSNTVSKAPLSIQQSFLNIFNNKNVEKQFERSILIPKNLNPEILN